MKRISTTLTAFSLALLVSACGGENGEAADAVEGAEPEVAEATSPEVEGAGEADTGSAETGEEMADDAAETTAEEASAASEQVAAAPMKRPPGFVMCAACHKVEPGQNGIGPSLAGVFGRKAGEAPDFEYSLAMKDSGLTWDEETLHAYLENPRAVVPDGTMIFVGEKNDERRQAVIDYLKSL